MSRPRAALGPALALASALAVSAPAVAESSLDLRYALSWDGVHAADMALRYEETAEGGYRSELSTRARGFAELLSRYRSTAVSEGRESAADDGGLAPASYRFVSEQRQRTRTIDVAFDPESGDVVELELRKNGEPRRSEVPPELRVGVVDPVTAIFSLRRQTAEALAGDGPERFAVSVFDGRRRYDIEAEVLGRRAATVDGHRHPVVEVRLDLRPLAGFDDSDLEKVPGEGGYVLAQLSDDERLVPLRVRTYGAATPTLARLVEDCSGDARRCAPGATN